MSRVLPTRITLPIIFGVAFATGFTGAVVPGSLLAVAVSESLRWGWIAGPVLMVGHALLELVAVVLLATGLIYFARIRGVQAAIGLLGGAVLVYLGYLTFGVSAADAAKALTASGAHAGAARGLLGLVGLGALMSVINPYWWLWWATLAPAHITWAMQRGRAGSATYYVGHILADVSWYSAVSIALAAGRTLLSPAVLHGIYIGAGVFLVAMGALFLLSGVKTLRRAPAPPVEAHV